ncbi:MAG: HD domain-containing protein [Coriobacteriia bacterium]|nr:HD domain-containing protein [Coriobacteriia bacterium]
MIRRPLGKHLHSQIIWPLAIASVVVAIIATIVAVSAIGTIVDRWIGRSAESAGTLVQARIAHRSQSTQRSLELIATDPRVMEAVATDDYSELRTHLSLAGRALGVDGLMVLDGSGAVIASVGGLAVADGERPLEADALDQNPGAGALPYLLHDGGGHFTVVATPLAGPGGQTWRLVAATDLNHLLGAECGAVTGVGFTVLDRDGTRMASAVHGDPSLGSVVLALDRETLQRAVAAAGSDPEGSDRVSTDLDGTSYRVLGRKLHFANDAGGPGAFLITVVDTQIARDAQTTTTFLIGMWLVFGVVGLAIMNWYVARRVTRPLETLSASVARVAGGDFTAKVEIGGSNEIADLADDFNRMTVSLKERSDSLTKKVLELATLYEMSRSLGSTLELETLLDSVLDSAMRIFDVEIGYVTMVDRETGALEATIWRGVDLSRVGETSVRSSMSDWVVREGRPLIFNPPADGVGIDDARGHADAVSGALAALCVPLLSNEGTTGAITVGTRNSEQRFTSDDVRLLATIANHVTIAVGNISLFSSVQEAYLATVRALAAAVDAKDPYTRGHSDGVAEYALMIGEAMDLSAEQMIALEMAAYLHDIGKIGISEDILLKPGKLTDAEMSQMRHHPLIGANILKPVAFPWPIAPIVRHHHEHYDGEGYPAGLRSEEIPILARVLTVADAFEAMVADRPYRRGRSQQEAILELRRCAGSHFDPRVVDAFIGVLERVDTGVTDVFPADEDPGLEETQAVLVAMCDGMFASFRRLGGPRLANNLERSANQEFGSLGMPLSLHAGHLSVEGEEEMTDEELVEHLRTAIGVISECIERASGAGLADHFQSEALAGLPERLRVCAGRLGFATAT